MDGAWTDQRTSRPLRVLLVEDSEHDAELVLRELRRAGFEPDALRVETAEAMGKALEQGGWDVVLSDYTLPGFGAPQALELSHQTDPDVPFILVSGTIGEERAVQIMHAGAADYVLKDNLLRLCLAVDRELREAENRRAHQREIAERRRAEEALRLLERAIQAVTQGILITDPNQPDNPIVYASPGFERMTGYSQAEVLGRNPRFLQGQHTDPVAAARVNEAIAAQRTCTVELLNYRADGTAFWNEMSLSPVRDENGRLTHFVGLQTDVTERRTLEEQYRQAQKMEAIGQLAGGVAHDFNNLLTVISGYSDLLLRRLPPEDPSRMLVEEILQAGERSAALTRQLLVFSRKQVVAPKVLELNAVVADAEKMLRRIIGEDVRLETALRAHGCHVRADTGQLEQVLLNLAVNARDAMPQGGRLSIETDGLELDEDYARLHTGVAPGSYVTLCVADTGSGMTDEVRAHIFEPFFTTKGSGRGTGLGLAVVHGVVQQAGGHVEVHSAPGKGSSFRVFLPRVEAPGDARRAGADRLSAPRGTETILLVEDDEGVRALSHHILIGHGYTVLQAADGHAALELAARHTAPIHLLVTDVVMPGLGGRQLAERILELRPDTKVLYLSGYTDDAVMRHGLLQEQVQFLQKPFRPVALARKVRDVLDAR